MSIPLFSAMIFAAIIARSSAAGNDFLSVFPMFLKFSFRALWIPASVDGDPLSAREPLNLSRIIIAFFPRDNSPAGDFRSGSE
jgi:hypothetical protein